MINARPADGLGTQIRRLLELLDGDLDKIYAEDGHGYRPRYTPVMKALMHGEALTIKEIAALSSLSHSAACQTIAKMTAEDLVSQQTGEDAREKLIRLTPKALAMLPKLEARWAATQAAADGLDAELSLPLSRILAEAIDALAARPFKERIATEERIAEPQP